MRRTDARGTESCLSTAGLKHDGVVFLCHPSLGTVVCVSNLAAAQDSKRGA